MLPVLHPFVVHVPIVLLLLSPVLALAYRRRRDPFFDRAAYGCLVIGWWGLFAAVLSGTLELALRWPLPEGALPWMNLHAVLGFGLLAIYGEALLRRKRRPDLLDQPGGRGYLRLLTLGAVLLLIDGWVGGHLVYGFGVGVR